jgi:hypothetical protein
LNMFFLLDLLGGILACNLACEDGGNNSVVQQNGTEATVYAAETGSQEI